MIFLLIAFFVLLIIYVIYSKSDLYVNEHNASINQEINKFKANFKELENLDINNNYHMANDHIYNN